MFYPQLVAGPIERPQNLIHQFYKSMFGIRTSKIRLATNDARFFQKSSHCRPTRHGG